MSVRAIADQIAACNKILAFVEDMLVCLGADTPWTLVIHSAAGSQALEVAPGPTSDLQNLLVPGLQTPMEALKVECETLIAGLGASMAEAAATSVKALNAKVEAEAKVL
jgi:hypothetical protein